MRILTCVSVWLLLCGISDVFSAKADQKPPQIINLSTPVHMPISWQNASNNGLARPAPPGGLRVAAPSAPSQSSSFAGTWKREKVAAVGEMSSLLLKPEGAVTASYAAEQGHAEQTVKGRWRPIEQTIRLDFTSQTDKTKIPALPETVLSVRHEGAGIVLVGGKATRFVRAEPVTRLQATNP